MSQDETHQLTWGATGSNNYDSLKVANASSPEAANHGTRGATGWSNYDSLKVAKCLVTSVTQQQTEGATSSKMNDSLLYQNRGVSVLVDWMQRG